MNQLQIFNSEEFGPVRSVMIDNEPWLVGKDVAVALGYENPQKAIKDHVFEEDKKMGERNVTPSIIDSVGREQFPTFINESGVYALVFGSKLESAKRFKHWVTSEVLPVIRKTGGYQMPQTYAEALRALADKAEEAERLQIENERMKPKEEFFDAVTDSSDAIDMKDTANALHMGIGRNKLFEFLRNQKILTQNNRPYQQYIDRGYFRVIEQKYDKPYGEAGVNIKTVVYQSGVDFIRRKLIEAGYGN